MKSKMVFLHGFLGCKEDCRVLVENIEGSYAIDLPGHGNAPIYCIDTLYESLPSGVTLIGYSLGARLVLRLLFAYPPKFSSAVLLSVHPGLQEEKIKKERILSDQTWAQLLEDLPRKEFLQLWYQQEIFKYSPVPLYRKQQNVKGLQHALLNFSLGKQPSYWEDIAKSALPLLFLFGAKDEKFLPIYERIKKIKNTQTELIEDASHALMLENPYAVVEKIQAFMRQSLS